jgi:hypothetical protein
MKLFRDKGVLEYSLMSVFSALMMFTWYHPLSLWLSGDELSIVLSTIIIGILAFFGNVLKSKLFRDEYLLSRVKSNVMGNKIIYYTEKEERKAVKIPLVKPKTFAGIAGGFLVVLMICIEVFASTQTALTFSNSIVESSVKNSGLYQNLQANAKSGRDETMAYNKAMDNYVTAKAQHDNNCNATWDENHMTKRQACFNSFKLEVPTLDKINMGSDVSTDDYNKMYDDKKSENAFSNAFLSVALVVASTFISGILLYLDYAPYKEVMEKIESSRIQEQLDKERGVKAENEYYFQSVHKFFTKDTEQESDSISKLSYGNCEVAKAKNDVKLAQQQKEAEEYKKEAQKIRDSLENPPLEVAVISPLELSNKKAVKQFKPIDSLTPKVELPKENFFDEPKKEESETLETLSDRIIAISEKTEDNTIDINGDIKLKLPTNKILSEELKMSESTLSDKLKLMETQGVLVIKSWGGGNKRGRYVES